MGRPILGDVAVSSYWESTPRLSIEAECARRGKRAVVDGCVDLLMGRPVDDALVFALGGPPARRVLDGDGADLGYWLRVWGARGLLWAWDDSALPAILAAFGDESWRVREMAAKVVARNLVGDALAGVALLVEDPIPRVRAAAARAVVRVTDAGV